MIIRDPNTGQGADVNDEGHLETDAFFVAEAQFINKEKQGAYSAVISKTPTGAGDCFFYMINNSETSLIMSSLRLRTASAESIQVKLGDSGTVGGTHATLTPVNRTCGSGNAADVTSESGVDITGLSGGLVVDEVYGSTSMENYEWKSGLIIPRSKMISLYAVTGAVALKATIGFYFR